MNLNFILTLAQARFPEPEFIKYTVPTMDYLETSIFDYGYIRLGLIIILMIFSGIAMYKWRSRKILLYIAGSSLLLLGFILPVCMCSVGAFQNIALASTHPTVPLSVETLLLFAIPLIVALFWGRLFCMGACPLGAFQELFHIKPLYIPLWVDRLGRYFAYFVLAASVALAATAGEFLACKIDPYVPIFRASFPMIATLVTLCFVIAGLFIYRPFCRFVCPYGVLLRFCALFSSKKVMISPDKCINCKLCQKGCLNNAILPNEPVKAPEAHAKSFKRTIHILLLTPFVMLFSGIGFYYAGYYLAKVHPDLLLINELNLKLETHRTDAFAISGITFEQLQERVASTLFQIEMIMLAFGLLGGLIIVIELLCLLRKTPRKEHEVDNGTCVMCGRCYEQCPLELAKRNEGKTA